MHRPRETTHLQLRAIQSAQLLNGPTTEQKKFVKRLCDPGEIGNRANFAKIHCYKIFVSKSKLNSSPK